MNLLRNISNQRSKDMTIEKLKSFGCNVSEGLQRCMNNEAFYLGLVDKFLKSLDLSTLHEALIKKDLDTAFKEAHSLKGVTGNLSLTPIYEALVEMVELLRVKTDIDYLPMFTKLNDLCNELKAKL